MNNNVFIQSTIEIFGTIIMAVIAMVFVIITGNKKKSEKNLFIIILASGFSLLMAACWYLCDGKTTAISIVMNRLTNFFVFICNPFMVICINRYICNLITENNHKVNRLFNIEVNIIAASALIIPITNILYDWMYYFDQGNAYHRLYGWYLYTLLNSIAMIICVISVIAQKNSLLAKQRID